MSMSLKQYLMTNRKENKNNEKFNTVEFSANDNISKKLVDFMIDYAKHDLSDKSIKNLVIVINILKKEGRNY